MNSQKDAALYEKFGCPPLNLSFLDFQRRRLCFRNERSLYTRKCDATGENIISIYSPDKPFKVYKSDHWYGDKWDALEYGQDFDFSRPFFEQFAELHLKIPRLALFNFQNVNSDYCNMTFGNKNCYLVFGSDKNEDCMYMTLSMHNISCIDIDYSNGNNLCYELCDSINCYGCRFAFDSKNCNDCYFISDCSGCSECILCTNLIQKSYCIENMQYSKEKYFEKKKTLIDGSYSKNKELFKKFIKLHAERVVKFSHTISCFNCTGDYLKNSKNCIYSFDISDSEDLKNVIFAAKSKDCFESSLLGDGTELCFNVISTWHAYNSRCSFCVIESSDVEYSKLIIGSQNILGCVGLQHKKYCILNKEYSETEYKALRKKIVQHMKKTGEWGQFFPAKLSDFGYNETSAHDYFPLTKREAVAQGYLWKEDKQAVSQPASVDIPDNILDINDESSDDITRAILRCEDCGKNYKIIIQELNFYKKLLIPAPRVCANCRHKKRMRIRNPRRLWTRKCQKCGIDLQSSYAPERLEKVYCEICYLQEVY